MVFTELPMNDNGLEKDKVPLTDIEPVLTVWPTVTHVKSNQFDVHLHNGSDRRRKPLFLAL